MRTSPQDTSIQALSPALTGALTLDSRAVTRWSSVGGVCDFSCANAGPAPRTSKRTTAQDSLAIRSPLIPVLVPDSTFRSPPPATIPGVLKPPGRGGGTLGTEVPHDPLDVRRARRPGRAPRAGARRPDGAPEPRGPRPRPDARQGRAPRGPREGVGDGLAGGRGTGSRRAGPRGAQGRG